MWIVIVPLTTYFECFLELSALVLLHKQYLMCLLMQSSFNVDIFGAHSMISVSVTLL